jgi:flagellin
VSVLRVYNNVIALNANRNLKITGMAIAKSLERLSSGLRINRAADDAAGLAISEKLRAQIRGLNRASSNALDGISLLQTAEGALNEVHSILQRMRELAVQAANGVYTAGDRQAIQLEVTQLVDEINRISKTTEFNTKTLLDGTMGALVSTDDFSKIRAAVLGNVGKGGNFVLKAVAKTTGQLQVQKTDVFTTTQNADAVGKINYLNTWRADATVATAGVDGVGNTGVYQLEVPVTVNGSLAVTSTVDGRIQVISAVVATGAETLFSLFQTEEMSKNSVDKLLWTVNTTTGTQTFSLVISSALTLNSLIGKMSVAMGTLTAGLGAVTASGEIGLTLAAGNSIVNTQFVDVDGNGSNFYLSFGSGATPTSNAFFISATARFWNNGAVYSAGLATLRVGGATGGATFSIGDGTTGAVHVRFDTRYDWTLVTVAATNYIDTIKWNKYSGGNSLQDYGKVWTTGAAPASGTFLVSAITARTYAVFDFNNQKYTSLVAGGTDMNVALAAARGLRMSNVAGGTAFSMGLVFAGAAGKALENVRFTVDGIMQVGETATFNLSTNNVLTGDQLNTLASLNRFQQYGVFNGRNNVELTIYQRGTDRAVTINLSKNDTFEDMANKISLALWNTAGTGIINSGILNPQSMPDLVHVNTFGNAKGTMSITTPVPGAEIVFAGDESLLKALSLVDVRKAAAPIYSVSAYNIERNQEAGKVIVDSNEINGLLPGLKLFFDNTLGLRLDPQPPISISGGPNTLNSFAYMLPIERPVVSLSGNVETMFIHVAPRDFTLQIGANQGQTITNFLSDMSAEALGVQGLLVVDSTLAQQAISTIDGSISKVSSERARLGAIQNRLESTIRNLDVASENLTASESRVRDVDVAQETMTSTRNQILLQAGVAALAQANQLPQVVLQLLR